MMLIDKYSIILLEINFIKFLIINVVKILLDFNYKFK